MCALFHLIKGFRLLLQQEASIELVQQCRRKSREKEAQLSGLETKWKSAEVLIAVCAAHAHSYQLH